jgi:hypothetical protein
MNRFFANDGYSFTGTFQPRGRPGLRFKYRSGTGLVQFQYDPNRMPAAAAFDAGAKLLAQYVGDLWELDAAGNESGETFSWTEQDWKLVDGVYYHACLNYVLGIYGPDVGEMEKNSGSASGSNSSARRSPPSPVPSA